MTCSICGGIILADTEDWGKPLCPNCFEGYERGVAAERARVVAWLREAAEFGKQHVELAFGAGVAIHFADAIEHGEHAPKVAS